LAELVGLRVAVDFLEVKQFAHARASEDVV
jgi:hypothetical protein